MKLYKENESYKIYQGKMQDMAQDVPLNSVDCIITDPPYELNFMNKGWDNSGVAFQKDAWKHCFDVLKDGGYLLAFGGSRTFHRIAIAIEDAGFEIRDTIMWLYGSGFPKSMNVGLALDKKNGVESIDAGVTSPNARPNSDKSNTLYESGTVGKEFTIKRSNNEWNGWGTCLKPAFEPVIIARKPFKDSLLKNIEKNRIGALNIDECRVNTGDVISKNVGYKNEKQSEGWVTKRCITAPSTVGRFPANVILTYDDTDVKEVCSGFPNNKSRESMPNNEKSTTIGCVNFLGAKAHKSGYHYGDEGSASRYFYCAKASKKDRDEGLDNIEPNVFYQADNDHNNLGAFYVKKAGGNNGDLQLRKNTHPCVKPTELMQYLIRLVAPKGATIMDCFMGSGSTGKAVMYENRERNAGYKFIGIEMTEEYLPIATARIDYVLNLPVPEKEIP